MQTKFTERELATILHGLRMIQTEGRIEGCAADACAHFHDVEALNNEEIDALCWRINDGAYVTVMPEEHPDTDLHRAGCTHCQYVHDKSLPNPTEPEMAECWGLA